MSPSVHTRSHVQGFCYLHYLGWRTHYREFPQLGIPRSQHVYEFHLKWHLDGLCAAPPAQGRAADPTWLQVSARRGCTCTQKSQNTLPFSPVREQTRVIPPAFGWRICIPTVPWLCAHVPAETQTSHHTHMGISDLQQPIQPPPQPVRRCRELQGVSLTWWYLRMNPGI